MYYGPDIMRQAGITLPGLTEKESSLALNIPLAFFNTVGTMLSVCFIDRLGRRYIILRTLPFIGLCWLVTAFGMAYKGEERDDET